MINKKASKWSEGVIVEIETADGRHVMVGAHVFDRPNARHDGDGFILFMPQYWYNRQPDNLFPWLRESWEVNAKVEPDGEGFRFDGPAGRGTIVPFDVEEMGYSEATRSLFYFDEDLRKAGTSIPEEWARIDSEELIRQASGS